MPNLQKLKKKELAKMCEKEGLSAVGNKNVLINRLQNNNEDEDNYQFLSSSELLERINLLEKTVADLRINNADKAFEPKSISSPIEAEFAMKTSIANMVQNNNAISNNSFPNPRISSCISQPTMLTQNISHAYNTQHTTTPGATYTNPWVTNSMNMQGIPAVFSKPSYPTYTTSVNNAQTTSSYYNTNNLFSNVANPNNVHNPTL